MWMVKRRATSIFNSFAAGCKTSGMSSVAYFPVPYEKFVFFFSLGAPIISVMVSSGIAFHHYGPHNM